MRSRLFLLFVISLILLACNANIEETNPTTVPSPTPVTNEEITELDTPTELPYQDCIWQWHTDSLPDHSAAVQTVLADSGVPNVTVKAAAFGENCLTENGEVNRFAAMQTDYSITVDTVNLDNPEGINSQLETVIQVLVEQFPEDQSPGPNGGQVTIAFIGDDGRMIVETTMDQLTTLWASSPSEANLLEKLEHHIESN